MNRRAFISFLILTVLSITLFVCTYSPKTSFQSTTECQNPENINPVIEDNFLSDPATLTWIKQNLRAPSKGPYKLKDSDKRDYSQHGQSTYLDKNIFHGKVGGRFIELGALDGEFLSNTLMFERTYNWTGLLIEALDERWEQLIKKNRRAYSLHGCIANVPKKTIVKTRAHVSETKADHDSECVSLAAVLQSLNWTHIDLLSLDVEGFEPVVLMSIPWHRVQIDVVMIECGQCQPNTQHKQSITQRHFLAAFMPAVGYEEVTMLNHLDLVYRKSTKSNRVEDQTTVI